MSSDPLLNAPILTDDVRSRIMSDPAALLEDKDIMRALVAANEKTMGGNIVDLRGIAMERLEARLDRLEDTHRNVIAAAYENLAGTNQINRAILRMMDATQFEPFLRELRGEVSDILRDAIHQAERRGITLYRIAKECELDNSIVYRFYHNECGLALSSVDKLCDFLGLELKKTNSKRRK